MNKLGLLIILGFFLGCQCVVRNQVHPRSDPLPLQLRHLMPDDQQGDELAFKDESLQILQQRRQHIESISKMLASEIKFIDKVSQAIRNDKILSSELDQYQHALSLFKKYEYMHYEQDVIDDELMVANKILEKWQGIIEQANKNGQSVDFEQEYIDARREKNDLEAAKARFPERIQQIVEQLATHGFE